MGASDSQKFDLLPDAVLVVDGRGSIVYANRHAEVLFGYERGEMDGLTVEALVPERAREEHEALRRDFTAAPTARLM
jgi:PAS domain S-box-containing protein